jgi:endonuclease YncB( thermonuclease family)
LNPTVMAGLIGAVVGGAVMMFSLPAALFGRVPVLSGELVVDAPLVAVVDGQTLRLRETVVRLQGVIAPPRGAGCRTPDGTAFDCGAAATQILAGLVRGHAVACHLSGRDALGFPQARCDSAGTDLNRSVVAAGWARAQHSAPDLVEDEAAARARHLGLWRSGAVAPAF